MAETVHVHNPTMSVTRLKSSTQFNVQQDRESPDWYRLRSTALSNKQLFMMLQAIWPVIVGPEPKKFALIHCSAGKSAGVWFHLLPNADYEPGCHEVMDL
jgi:hypothetical protein